MNELQTIEGQLAGEELFEAFKKQLEKDFSQSNFSTEFITSLTPDYYSIRDAIARVTGDVNKSANDIMRLLNRVDISQSQRRKYLDQHRRENYYHVLAELIIKRILQKVVIKRIYK